MRGTYRRLFHSELRLHGREAGARFAQGRRDRLVRSLRDEKRLRAHLYHTRRTVAAFGRLDGTACVDFRTRIREDVLSAAAPGNRRRSGRGILRAPYQGRTVRGRPE